ncbi:MAG: DNA adenine methylase [Chloroflexaceae bacterium]|nr:DNA adenine methylase [Chloroflexaceae bacterium]
MLTIKETRQLHMFASSEFDTQLDSRMWSGSFNGRESTLQQLSPYIGKLKSGMARALVEMFSQPGDVVLDPFSGSGVVPLEAALAGRHAWASDLSPYAYALTRGKLETPSSETVALTQAKELLDTVESVAPEVDLNGVPFWIQEFFHPTTLREVVAAFQILRSQENWFLLSCLLGILHHQRPGKGVNTNYGR